MSPIPLNAVGKSETLTFNPISGNQKPEVMSKIKELLLNCSTAIDKAHSNAAYAHQYKIQVDRFLAKNEVKNDDETIDYEKSKSKVNFHLVPGGVPEVVPEVVPKVVPDKYYVGNHYNWSDFLADYVGKWTMDPKWNNTSDYVFVGRYANYNDVKNDIKDTGVETFKDSGQFYGKFEEGNRKSGVYTWLDTKTKSFYMGDLNDNINGHGCLQRIDGEKIEFIFGLFQNNNMPVSYVLKKDKEISWVVSDVATILNENDISQISHFLNKVSKDYEKLGIWEDTIQKLEDKTGLNRTSLYTTAALALAGVGFWAYKKYKKSSTQKNKALSRGEKAAITRKKNKAAKEAAASVSVSGSNSASAMEDNAGSGSASAMGSNVAAGTRKNKSASKSARRSEAAKKGALTRAAKKAAKAANVKVEGSNVKVEGSDAVWRSPAENKEDESKAVESKV